MRPACLRKSKKESKCRTQVRSSSGAQRALSPSPIRHSIAPTLPRRPLHCEIMGYRPSLTCDGPGRSGIGASDWDHQRRRRTESRSSRATGRDIAAEVRGEAPDRLKLGWKCPSCAPENTPNCPARGNKIGMLRPRLPATTAAIVLTAVHANGESFATDVRAMLDQHCVVCHGPQLQMAELRFDEFSDEAEALRHPGVWDDVLRVTREGKMPPAGSPRPDQEQLDALWAWVRNNRNEMEQHRSVSARPITARRLNREEYNNTVRDLLGVDLRPADSFPVDDSGYGFDNIGDVLSVSPLLMEKYVDAAERLAEEAVWAEPRTVRPTRFRIQRSKQLVWHRKSGTIHGRRFDPSEFQLPRNGLL